MDQSQELKKARSENKSKQGGELTILKTIQVYKDSYGEYPETQYAKGKL
jgi:hypothetical protein